MILRPYLVRLILGSSHIGLERHWVSWDISAFSLDAFVFLLLLVGPFFCKGRHCPGPRLWQAPDPSTLNPKHKPKRLNPKP